MHRSFSNNIYGFTLTEVIVVVSISTVLMLVITLSVSSIYKNNAYALAQTQEVDTARRGIQTWIKDTRELDYGANGAYPIVIAEPHRFAFYADIDPDAVTEYLDYQLSSTTLYRRVYKASGFPAVYDLTSPATSTLSEYVQNEINIIPTFQYYNATGNLIANPQAMITDIRYITLTIIVNIDPVRSPGEFKLQGSAAPRNIKDNL